MSDDSRRRGSLRPGAGIGRIVQLPLNDRYLAFQRGRHPVVAAVVAGLADRWVEANVLVEMDGDEVQLLGALVDERPHHLVPDAKAVLLVRGPAVGRGQPECRSDRVDA